MASPRRRKSPTLTQLLSQLDTPNVLLNIAESNNCKDYEDLEPVDLVEFLYYDCTGGKNGLNVSPRR